MQPEQQAANSQNDVQAIAQYLVQNPDFFNQHADILSNLRIPHHTGAAVSLVEKQVSVLRKKCTSLENKLSELILVARENEKLHQRLHMLIQEVISASSLDAIIALTRESLMENFRADEFKLYLIDDKAGRRHAVNPERFLRFDAPELDLFASQLSTRETSCGPIDDATADFLFSDAIDEDQTVEGSIAVIPLYCHRSIGIAVLYSQDYHRFESDRGVMFLNQLGEVLSRRIYSFI